MVFNKRRRLLTGIKEESTAQNTSARGVEEKCLAKVGKRQLKDIKEPKKKENRAVTEGGGS